MAGVSEEFIESELRDGPAREGTIRVTEVLHPIGVAMAGAGEFDPYRD